jgi:hypothetical protein
VTLCHHWKQYKVNLCIFGSHAIDYCWNLEGFNDMIFFFERMDDDDICISGEQ